MPLKIGFHFIPFPQSIVDDGLKLSLGEYRLLGYLLRHQIRLGKAVLRLTQDDLFKGRRLSSGERSDKGCGITSGRDLKLAKDALVGRDWLEATDTPEGTIYTLVIDDDDDVKVQNALFPKVQNVARESAKRTRHNKESLEGLIEGKPLSPVGDGPDPRFKPVVDEYGRLYKQHNPTAPAVPFSARDGKILKTFLQENPKWSEFALKQCVRHRFQSDVNRAEMPSRWFPRLLEYANGPVAYGRPKAGFTPPPQPGRKTAFDRDKEIMEQERRAAEARGKAAQ